VAVAGTAAAVAALFGLAAGPVAISFGELLAILGGRLGLDSAEAVSPVKTQVVEQIRAPRVLLGLLAGAVLGVSGAAMQGLFRNPLADPSLIGVSAGGALAAVAVIVLGPGLLGPLVGVLGGYALPAAAFAGSLATVALIYRLSQLDGRVVVATMLLAGVAANALATAGIGYFIFLADDEQLRDLTFWTLGTLGGATWDSLTAPGPFIVLAIVGLLGLARGMNCLLLGEADAGHLGIRVERLKTQAAVLTALGVGAATALCGIIGFIGLVTPHLVRLMTGPDHRYVLPGSALLGAALIVTADLVARLAVVPAELPLGVVTATIGAPFFFWLLLRGKRQGMG
jgi:iron complex transport system permease protein